MAITCAKILVVDDNPTIQNLIFRFLGQKNYQIESAYDGKSALETFERFNPDLVILDVNLPDAKGYDLCEPMQSCTDVFILMLSRYDDIAEKIKSFSKGADDFLTKPFDLQELEFRVQALLKRQRRIAFSEKQPLVFDNLVIDPVRREVKVKDNLVPLTTLEFDLLHFLACHPGRVWRRAELIQEVWDYDYIGDQRVVNVHIRRIRKKLETDVYQPFLIQAVRGVGYKFETSVMPVNSN